MDRALRATRLFESGAQTLEEASSDIHCQNYESLLIRAAQDLDTAARLTQVDTKDYNIYTQIYASARAACLSKLRYDSRIDTFFSSSPMLAKLAVSELHCTSDTPQSAPATTSDYDLEEFWSKLGQTARQGELEAHKELVAWDFRKRSWLCFEKALLCSLENNCLARFWYGCIAAVLYLELDPELSAKVARCITAMRRVLELDELANPGSIPSEYPSIFSQTISTIHIDSSLFVKRISWLQSLAIHYARRLRSEFAASMQLYELNPDNRRCLNNAIGAVEAALEWTHDTGLSPTLRLELLYAHGHALSKRYHVYHRSDDLEAAATSLREALACEVASADQLASCKELLAVILSDLVASIPASIERDPEYFAQSFALWREIVDLATPDSTGLLAQRLLALGKAAYLLYDTDDGTLAYLIEGSECLARAARVATDPALVAEVLFTRAKVLEKRQDHPDFRECLEVGHSAFQLVQSNLWLLDSQPCYVGCTLHAQRLLDSVRERVTHRDPRNDIDKLYRAIDVFKLVISVEDGEFLSSSMFSLGAAYELLYRMQVLLGEPVEICTSTLQTALDASETSLKQTKSKDREYQEQLCHALTASIHDDWSRLPGQDCSSQSKHINLAIDHYRHAKDRVGNHAKLAAALERRYIMHGQRQDLDECVSRLVDQHQGRIAPRQAFYMSKQLVRVCHEHVVPDHLLGAYRLVFKALRRMSHLRNTSMMRYEALVTSSAGFACDAAASALINNDTTAAIELLEQGRGCFFSELLPMQTDSSRIRLLDPELADEVERRMDKIQKLSRATEENIYDARMRLTHPRLVDDADEIMHDDETPKNVRLSLCVSDLEEALRDVRKLPGYHDESQPKSFSGLAQTTRHCPVVYLNVSRFRCDALIVKVAQGLPAVLTVSLATSLSEINRMSQTMRNIVHDQGRGFRDSNPNSTRRPVWCHTELTPEQQIRDVLRQLWETVVQPVLVALDFIKPPGSSAIAAERLPHICWCPTGPLATFLPLHAAGDYDLGPEHWVITHVVSAYTPTLSSLARALERTSTTGDQGAHVLLISQPASPPNMPLPCVNSERDAIVSAVNQSKGNGQVTVLHDKAGLVANAMALLPTHGVLHLACHGKQDRDDPLESAILLYDGEMKLREIIKTTLHSAELVYLSACQTATGDINTPEESLSLAAGFLFAGYKGAVASMWSINDKDGADVAKSFYDYLLEQDGPPAMNAALALHRAIHDLRAANPDVSLLRWIPFMYLGVTGGTKLNEPQAVS